MAVIQHATFEVDTDDHAVWFSCTVVRSTIDPIAGDASLLVTASDSFTGVEVNQYPGYAGVVAGQDYDFSISYVEAIATMPTVTWRLRWTDDASAEVGTNDIPLPRATTATTVGDTFTAPAGATHVRWSLTTTSGGAGWAYRIDDVIVDDAASGGVVELEGMASAATAAIGELSVDRPLAGTANAASAAAGSLAVSRALAGTATAASDATGAILVDRALAGVSSSASSAAGALSVTRELAGVASAASSASGALTTGVAPSVRDVTITGRLNPTRWTATLQPVSR